MTTVNDDPLVRIGRWALAKVWFGVIVSGGYALGRHFDWPQAFLTTAAVLGAVALAMASSFLPVWTQQRPSGIPVADVGLRVMVWGGLTVSVIALLVGMPAVGMVAAALLFNTASRTFGDPFAPLLRRLRITPAVRHGGRPARSAHRPVPGAARTRPDRPAPGRVPAGRPEQRVSRAA